MMIASRFRTVLWVSAVAGAALGCYLVSLQVAAERIQVTKLDRRLVAARIDIRDLSTELDTRGRLVQLERWNADVLALSAPRAAQYLSGEMQLASLGAGGADALPDTPVARALQAPAGVAKVAYNRIDGKPASRLLHSVSLDLGGGMTGERRATAQVAYLDGKSLRP